MGVSEAVVVEAEEEEVEGDLQKKKENVDGAKMEECAVVECVRS